MVVVVANWCSKPQQLENDLPEASGPQVKASVGPNSNLPELRAGSQGCASMDAVLSDLLTKTTQGKVFTAKAAQIRSQQTNPDSGTVNATPEWAQFLQILPEHYTEFQKAAGKDEAAKKALINMRKIVDIEPKLVSGEIPEYRDTEAAHRELEEGKTPEQNPEYVKKTEQLDKLLDQVTWCMPTWPVVYGQKSSLPVGYPAN